MVKRHHMDKDKHRAPAAQFNAESSYATKQSDVEAFSILTDAHISSVHEGVEAILESDLDGADVHLYEPDAGGTSYFYYQYRS